MRKVIGVVAHGGLFTTELTNEDRYYFGNNYMKRIEACGGLPLGMLPTDGILDEAALDYCDAFVICGGSKFWPYHFQVLHHIEATGKKLLGICQGMQVMNQYFLAIENAPENTPPVELFSTPKPDLGSVEGHANRFLRDREEESKHAVSLVEGSLISRLVGGETALRALSAHKHCVATPSKHITVTGYAEDGTIEVIERGDYMLGVQFHPEADDKLISLFRWLCD